MFGSYPCYPGFQDRLSYVGTYFYCSICHGVVSPQEVSVAVVDPQGHPRGLAAVLRCKNHAIQGTYSSGPLTTLWGLVPKHPEAVSVRERMSHLCFRVRNLDILTLISSLGGGGLILAGIVLCVIVASPTVLGLPLWSLSIMICGVGCSLCLLGAILNYFARNYLRKWLRLSQDYVQCCSLVAVQEGTEKYAVLTEFPPSCHVVDPLLSKVAKETSSSSLETPGSMPSGEPSFS
ncbi:hypothetical protein [Chlamydia gallinacea]|uniref:Uncharacterized protein n=2 Tax=Chlamydia gallinacea TaxID=1457153 RepID=A0A173DZG3_9CHLA|nr:hypothetical protein [Chlamydia gallinacea]ANG66321.1 hypothetical protein M787_003225 [Chlamydia gallinacea 08-1274/3]AQT77474.1 hypothetical protein B1F83_02370 [Chlamydia gallinacea]EYE61866.1 hypothetical protein M127_4978 [Bacteroides fragilis str. S6L5]MBX6679782.1 hypothetical protein [Chlamydia gallinacea]